MSGKIIRFPDRPPLVSIVIALYNKGAYVQETLDSCFAQTYKGFEVIVVDDGSADSGPQISRQFPVKIVNVTNRGIAGARNAGVMNSSGDLILPLDADDIIHPWYLEKTVPLMTEDAGIVSTDMQRFGNQTELLPAKVLTYEQERQYNEIPVCSLINRQAFLECGGYTPRVPGYEDWALWTDILRRGWKMAVVNEPLFFYRTGCNTANNEADKHREKFTRLIHEWHPL